MFRLLKDFREIIGEAESSRLAFNTERCRLVMVSECITTLYQLAVRLSCLKARLQPCRHRRHRSAALAAEVRLGCAEAAKSPPIRARSRASWPTSCHRSTDPRASATRPAAAPLADRAGWTESPGRPPEDHLAILAHVVRGNSGVVGRGPLADVCCGELSQLRRREVGEVQLLGESRFAVVLDPRGAMALAFARRGW